MYIMFCNLIFWNVLWPIHIFILYFSFHSVSLFVSVDYVYSEDFKTGTNHTFRPSIQGPIERIDWRYNGNLVVDWDNGSDPTWFRLKERASLDIKTGDLTLQLKKEDSGLFKGQFQVNGILHYFERTITVIGKWVSFCMLVLVLELYTTTMLLKFSVTVRLWQKFLLQLLLSFVPFCSNSSFTGNCLILLINHFRKIYNHWWCDVFFK